MTEYDNKPEISLHDVDQPRAWRVGWPCLCRSRVQTLYTQGATSVSKSNVEALRSRINTILSRHQIEPRQFPGIALWLGPVYRTNVKYQEDPPNEHLCFLVECVFNPERHKEDPLSWSNAVIDIHKALYDIIGNSCSIGVEHCDTVCEKSLFLTDFPSSSEEFRKNWDDGSRYRQQILEKLKKGQAPWQAMVPVGLTASNEYMESYICVVWIDAQNANDSIWVQIQRNLQSILPDSISVEIWQASNSILSSSHEALKMQTSDDGNIGKVKGATLPKPGSSLGCLSEKALFKKVTYALTNSHVVLRSKPHLWRGIQSTTQAHYPSQEIPVQCPYEKDQQVQSMEYKLVDLEAHEAALHRDPLLGYVRGAALGSRSHNVSTFDYRLGMDIALIELIDPSTRPEKVFLNENLLNDRALETWDVCDLGSNTDSEDICIVGKYGAASGLTTGLLHGIKVDMKLNGFPDAISTWVVRSPSIGECFTRPGDSGSFVFTTTF
ncbi:hypothetical protein BGW36DRAFT_431527 [Talaromyces proteolyticus]|uniref:Uncharacterized protein n=1 Tax=Talaromyces proteolyticus TaxID=1131652 RepID=A0AAD4PX73_9EURO|nr:uncharacterized protein BGW36DRAFT_431527 [Talaromyces proteolyticus]KAH8692309.1 hypothetical protein BGW36DRAFT_431527 [Talaromyces proteolyticus]